MFHVDPARDFEATEALSNNQRWLASWHPAETVPDGTNHGAAGVCLTRDGKCVLISSDGVVWDLPGGRPDPGERAEETLRREVREEACAEVTSARLLGYCRAECIGGNELGLILVRSLWRAEVALNAWAPEFETTARRIVKAREAPEIIGLTDGLGRVIARALREAMWDERT